MGIITFVQDEAILPQAGFEVPAEIIQSLQQKGFSLTFPQTAGDLHAIARKHEHALAHYVKYIIERRDIIFCIQSNNASDFFTFHMSSDGRKNAGGVFHHIVGYRNAPPPEDVKEVGSLVAESLIDLLKDHVKNFESNIQDNEGLQ